MRPETIGGKAEGTRPSPFHKRQLIKSMAPKRPDAVRPPPLATKKSALPSTRQDLASPVLVQRKFTLSKGVIRLLLQLAVFFGLFWLGNTLMNRRATTSTVKIVGKTAGPPTGKSSSAVAPSHTEKNGLTSPGKPQVKGCFVMLTRNGDLHSVRATVRQIEDRLNRRYNYPYIFINDQPFTEKFKDFTSALTNAQTFYGEIPADQWGWPSWVDQQQAQKNMQKMEEQKVLYGGSLSYRHMCRYESGFFFRHQLMDQCDFYWRIEPGVYYYCDMEDPFAQMAKANAKYGFTISLLEYKETIPTLFKTVLSFMKEWNANHPNDKLPRDERMFSFITDDEGETYNLCHFWSNFESVYLLSDSSEANTFQSATLRGSEAPSTLHTLNILTRLAISTTVSVEGGYLANLCRALGRRTRPQYRRRHFLEAGGSRLLQRNWLQA